MILSHCLFLLAMPIFLLFPISSTQELLHFCYKPISVIHIWKAFNLYFLHYFVDIALFPKIFITFKGLNKNKTFLTVFSGQCLISWKPIFLGYLKPHRASKWLILKLIYMPWQWALHTNVLSTWKSWQEHCELRRMESLAS